MSLLRPMRATHRRDDPKQLLAGSGGEAITDRAETAEQRGNRKEAAVVQRTSAR
jgi:hypothetical protein